jgi:hypothetical protein
MLEGIEKDIIGVLSRLESLNYQWSLMTWQVYNYLPITMGNRQSLLKAYGDLYRDDELYEKVLQGIPVGINRLLKKLFTCARFYLREQVTDWYGELTRLYTGFRYTDGHDELTGNDIKIGLLDPSRKKRENCFRARQQRGEKLAGLLINYIPKLNKCSKEKGFTGFTEYRCFDNEVSREQVNVLLEEIKGIPMLIKNVDPVDLPITIKKLEAMTTSKLEVNFRKKMGLLCELTPSILKKELEGLKYYLDRELVSRRAKTNKLQEFVVGSKLKALEGLKRVKEARKKHLTTNKVVETAFCMPVRIPDDIRIRLPGDHRTLDGGVKGYGDLKTLFHETGHGLHFGSMIQPGPGGLYHVTEPGCFKEAMAKFFELYFFHELVERHEGVDISGFKLASLMRLKHHAIMVDTLFTLAERTEELVEEKGRKLTTGVQAREITVQSLKETTKGFPGIYSEYMDCQEERVNPRSWLGMASACEDPYYYLEYFLSSFTAYQLYNSYRETVKKNEKERDKWFKFFKKYLLYPANQVLWTDRVSNFLTNLDLNDSSFKLSTDW